MVHKPWIDEVNGRCRAKKAYRRVPEVIDCWLDSAACPSRWLLPHHNREVNSRRPSLADFITERRRP
ncbi:MAG: hypothetical protein R3B99_12995 [Polyangiales bacterium]